jgi:hypothetical protein
VIDNPAQVERLLGRLKAALPLVLGISPPLAATIQGQAPNMTVPTVCQVTWVSYAGDEGGIMCRLQFDDESRTKQIFASLTHLVTRPGTPLAHEISAYQKHRRKRLRRGASPD